MTDQSSIGNMAVAEAPAPPIILSFTPSLMSEGTLREIFVARQPLVDRLVRDLQDATTSNARRHALLIGPRGIGKTHLVSMVYYAVKADAALYDRLRVAWMREEEWSVFSYADLLVRIFRALANEYPHERAVLSPFADRLMRMPVKEGEAAGEAKLLEWLDGRLLLLIVENVNDIFEGMGEAGQQALRALLQNHSRVVLLATSPMLTSDLSEYDAPFYGYFNVTHLKELTREEARQLLYNIAANVEHDAELADYLQTEEADRRLRVIEMLAGGHPRIWILFSGCMSRQNLDELVPLFLKMLDDLTPYYQDLMRALPPQERRIVAYLCERSGAVPVKEIAADCRLKPNHAAALLGKLEEKGYVRKAPEPTLTSVGDRRIAHYEIREPLMRLCIEVKENRASPLRLIVEFLRCWFSEEAIQERLNSLPPYAAMTRRYLEAALERQREVLQDTFRLCHEANRYFGAKQFEEALNCLDRAISLNQNASQAWIMRAMIMFELQRWAEVLECLDHITGQEPGTTLMVSIWKALCSVKLLQYGNMIDALKKVLNISIREKNIVIRFLIEQIFSQMLQTPADRNLWNMQCEALTSAFVEANAMPLLANGLTQTIQTLLSEVVTDGLAQDWLAAWETAARDQPQMDVALRLLRAAVAWKRTRDRGVLLNLAAEERTILGVTASSVTDSVRLPPESQHLPGLRETVWDT